MSPDGGGEPDGDLAAAIDDAFGYFDSFKEEFKTAGVNRFGSGWAWLVHDGSGLAVVSTANQDSPISDGKTPIIGVDVWEHAYYLKYQNKRPDYLDAWWNVVNWAKAAEHFSQGRKAAGRRRRPGRCCWRRASVKRLLALLSLPGRGRLGGAGRSALAVERVEATFFAEYTAPSYRSTRARSRVFANRDPFLAHGVVSDAEQRGEPLFQRAVTKPGGARSLHGAPFLTTGTYPFHCPVHDDDDLARSTSTPTGRRCRPMLIAPTASRKRSEPLRLGHCCGSDRLTVTVEQPRGRDVDLTARAGKRRSLLTAQPDLPPPGPEADSVLGSPRALGEALKARGGARAGTPAGASIQLGVDLTVESMSPENAGATSTALRLRLRRDSAASAREAPRRGVGGIAAIACSASAVIVRLGLTPGLAGIAEPSQTSRFS